MNQQRELSKILLLGDSCLDVYRVGSVDRISPEAPVPVVKIIEEYTVPGMAANVHLNLINLGATTDFISNHESIIKTRYIDRRSGQHLLRVDSEDPVNQWDYLTPCPLDEYSAIVVSDYNKGFLTYTAIESLIAKFNGPIFIDTKKTDLARFSGNNVWIKINEVEYKNCTSKPENLIVTMASRGALLKQHNSEKLYPAAEVEVVDVCGCGDTFLASLTWMYLLRGNIGVAIEFANKAAGLTVQHRGNYAPKMEELVWND